MSREVREWNKGGAEEERQDNRRCLGITCQRKPASHVQIKSRRLRFVESQEIPSSQSTSSSE